MRTIIFNGKGGVGKTSVAAATARRIAQNGHCTIIMSVDTAHSLGDSYEVQLGAEIKNIAPNLDALELDIVHEMSTKWNAISEYIAAFMLSQGVNDISAEEMAILPGMEMVAALFYVLQFKDSGQYDVVVIDTAPTGETLRLLSFPDVSNWYIEKMYGMFKRLISIARYTVGKVMDIPLPSKEVMQSIEDIKVNMERVKEILEDHEHTTIRLVLNPEKMAIVETRRSYTYLCLYNKTVECLVINKIYPKEAEGPFFKDKLIEQEKHIAEIHQSFDPLKIMSAYMMPTELHGPDMLDNMATMIYGESDPIEVYATESPMHFETKKDIDYLYIKMPFIDESTVELFKTNDNSIIIQTSGQRRTVTLPLTLKSAEMLGAEFRDGSLVVKFRRKSNAVKED
jgi:arsenite/tail-anchored protein-transporting ATPase